MSDIGLIAGSTAVVLLDMLVFFGLRAANFGLAGCIAAVLIPAAFIFWMVKSDNVPQTKK